MRVAIARRATRRGLFSIENMCDYMEVSSQGYRAFCQRLETCRAENEQALRWVDSIRRVLPRLGVRKLYWLLEDWLPFGRDALFSLLRRTGRLIKSKRKSPYTTQSYHSLRKFRNLIKNTSPLRPGEVVVSDMTYLKLKGGTFCYASLVTDLYSRKIVGYYLGEDLRATGPMKAFEMAKKELKEAFKHHSDRGIQYCSASYVTMVNNAGGQMSMTEENHCYENAVAERVNGILKGEFSMGAIFHSAQHAKRALRLAVNKYNQLRPHTNLGYKTPDQVHYSLKQTPQLF